MVVHIFVQLFFLLCQADGSFGKGKTIINKFEQFSFKRILSFHSGSRDLQTITNQLHSAE